MSPSSLNHQLNLKSEPKHIPHAQPSEITGPIFFPLDDGGWVKWDYLTFVTTPEQTDVYLFCQFKNANCKNMDNSLSLMSKILKLQNENI